MFASIDFETYSEAGYRIDPVTKKVTGVGSQGKGGLPAVGTPNYAEHHSADVICLSFSLDGGKTVETWTPFHLEPTALLDHVRAGLPVYGWNITFEFYIWNVVCVKRYGWPPLQLEQCYCSMAKSRRHSLPGALGNCAKVLGTVEQKDNKGKSLIQKLCRPHTPTKARPGIRWTPELAWPEHLAMYEYCEQDVRTEIALNSMIPDLTPDERATWLVDQTINVRGVAVDVDTLDACLDLLQQAENKYTLELATITEGAVGSVSENAKFLEWLASQGVHTANMQKETVAQLLEGDIPGSARRALEIRQTLNSANVKKLRSLKLQVSSDGRLRDQYTYCGADRTGRASAGGVQLQNITGKGPRSFTCNTCGRIIGDVERCVCGNFVDLDPRKDWDVNAVEWAAKDIATRDLAYVESVWGDRPIDLLCGMLRGLFWAREGYDLICCDFSAIEAVVLACLSRCQWRIDVFNNDEDIYERSAAKATGTPYEEIRDYRIENEKSHPLRKTIGKVRELAGGYSGWVGAWKNFGADKFMSDEEIKADVLKWREESKEIVEFWGGQYRWCGPGKWDYRYELHGLEGAAIMAIQYPGQEFRVHDIVYICANNILYCVLPSGRRLHYHRPKLIHVEDRLKRGPLLQITFEGYNSNPTKGPIGWGVMDTYGGRLAENCIAEGTLVLTDRGWIEIEEISLSDKVHDGDDWVAHGGLLFKSEQDCVSLDGVLMTPDHEVLTDDGWKEAKVAGRLYRPTIRQVNCAYEGRRHDLGLPMRLWGDMREDCEIGLDRHQERERIELRLPQGRPVPREIRDASDFRTKPLGWAEMALEVPLRLWRNLREGHVRCSKGREEWQDSELRVHDQRVYRQGATTAWHDGPPRLCGVPINGRQVSPTLASGVAQLRGPWNNGLRSLERTFRKFLGRHENWLSERGGAGSQGQQQRVLPGKLPVGGSKGERQEPKKKPHNRHAFGSDDGRRVLGEVRREGEYDTVSPESRLGHSRAGHCPRPTVEKKPVYDILNCGPMNRFVVLGQSGPFIVHNCTQAVAADIQFESLRRLEARGYPVVMHTHDEAIAELPLGVGTWEDMASIMSERPAWASWWPIKADGWNGRRYRKE